MNVTNDGKAIIQPRFTPLAVLSNDTRTKYVLDECGKTYTAVNKANHIGVRLQIDGRLILSGNKCDKGLLLDDERFFLVELKGKNYPHAVEQLINTKKWIESKYPDFCFKFFPE